MQLTVKPLHTLGGSCLVFASAQQEGVLRNGARGHVPARFTLAHFHSQGLWHW
jgi:hypothetical protein